MRLLGVVLLVLLAVSPLAFAQQPALRIDVPVKLEQACRAGFSPPRCIQAD